jgi:endo-1,4-beta-D-glucanase Y
MPKVSTPYDTILKKTWEGIKKRNIDPYRTGMVHRPRSEFPGDAVSEGISYGMFLALYCNDQTYFNKIWNGAETYMWSGGAKLYNWRRDSQGNANPAMGQYNDGPASDAEQDIALLLIFADQLVKNNIWRPYTDPKNNATYAGRARDMLGTIRTTMIKDGKILLPGNWGGDGAGTINPSYFSPGSYEIFAEFDPENASAWKTLTDGVYEMLAKSPGYSRGLAPDWYTFEGRSTGGAGYNAYFAGDAMYMDAIRIFWKIGLHYLWYRDERAKSYLSKAINFLGSPEKANFFTMNGELLPDTAIDAISDGKGGKVERPRRMHNHLTVGMWGIAAMAVGGAEMAEEYSDEFLKFYDAGNDFFAHASDPEGGNDTLHCDMYYDQFLGWFGASVLGGAFTNVWEDLKDGVPQGPPAWESRPVLDTNVINAEIAPLRVTASFSRSIRWTVTLKHDSTGQTVSFGGNSKDVNAVWYGLSQTGGYMPQGFYTLTVSGAGISDVYTEKVWLGKPFASVNLMVGNRLLIDDFADGDAIPYIGKEWKSFLDSDFGKPGRSTAEISIVSENNGNKRLHWKYSLMGRDQLGYDPHAGLEWTCQDSSGGPCDLRGIDTLIIAARVASGVLGVSVQLVSSDFNFPAEYQYFSDSLNLKTTDSLFRMPLSKFKQRADGSGKNLQTTLSKLTGIRFQVQDSDGKTGTIIVDRAYFTGDVSKLYRPPPPAPDYIAPPEGAFTPPIGVRYRADPANMYSVKRVGNSVIITLTANMAAEASASLVDIRGRTVMRLDVQRDGKLSVPLTGVAKGVYFVDIRGRGRNIKVRVVRSK